LSTDPVLINLLNPKLTIFFAFLPQFVPARAARQLPTMLTLSGVFMAMTFASYGVFAAGMRRHLLDPPASSPASVSASPARSSPWGRSSPRPPARRPVRGL